MSKIKIITDSASDINLETAKKLDIKVIGFPITLDGKSLREGVDFTTDEFYIFWIMQMNSHPLLK